MPARDGNNNGRDGSSGHSSRNSGGGDVGLGADGDGGEGFESVGGEPEEAQVFFKFYPFLNDVAHNEMDSDAR